jgi:hypothetical protein
MSDLSRSLVLVNYFRDLPNFPEACKDNSAPLLAMLDTCRAASGDRWANFIAVDFYKVPHSRELHWIIWIDWDLRVLMLSILWWFCPAQRSDRGGAAEATDKANGGLVCGCGSIAACNVTWRHSTCSLHSCRLDKLFTVY